MISPPQRVPAARAGRPAGRDRREFSAAWPKGLAPPRRLLYQVRLARARACACMGPHRLEAQDGALSRRKPGFESPWGRQRQSRHSRARFGSAGNRTLLFSLCRLFPLPASGVASRRVAPMCRQDCLSGLFDRRLPTCSAISQRHRGQHHLAMAACSAAAALADTHRHCTMERWMLPPRKCLRDCRRCCRG